MCINLTHLGNMRTETRYKKPLHGPVTYILYAELPETNLGTLRKNE